MSSVSDDDGDAARAAEAAQDAGATAQAYTLVTRALVKLRPAGLERISPDRAVRAAEAAGRPLILALPDRWPWRRLRVRACRLTRRSPSTDTFVPTTSAPVSGSICCRPSASVCARSPWGVRPGRVGSAAPNETAKRSHQMLTLV